MPSPFLAGKGGVGVWQRCQVGFIWKYTAKTDGAFGALFEAKHDDGRETQSNLIRHISAINSFQTSQEVKRFFTSFVFPMKPTKTCVSLLSMTTCGIQSSIDLATEQH